MGSLRLLLALAALACAWAAVQDDCLSLKYVNAHSQDMVVDYRNSWIQGDDTARFKRDMQGGRNPDAHANEFWVIYKSRIGFKTFKTVLDFYRYANLPPEQDRSFLISTDGVTYRQFTAFTESGDKSAGANSPFFIREYAMTLPADTYFVQIKFANWVNQGSINYWTPQIHNVTFTEVCDLCGNGVCGDRNSFGEPENCNNCPRDCGACPKPTCGNGVCEFGEGWAPRTDGTPYTKDMGPLTCPEDCGTIKTPGNLRCDAGEVCHSQTPTSCADCCPQDVFVVNQGACGNGLCDGFETCISCPGDCGACPRCGDGVCNGIETCRSCAADCAVCPDPTTCAAGSPPPPPPPPPPPSPPATTAAPVPAPPTCNLVTVDDAVRGTGANQFNFVGAWTYCAAGCAPGSWAGTDSVTQSTTAYATFQFTGSQFWFYATVGNSRGNIAISVDGAAPAVVSEVAATAQGNVMVYTTTVARGTHTIRFSNPNANTARVTIDRIVFC